MFKVISKVLVLVLLATGGSVSASTVQTQSVTLGILNNTIVQGSPESYSFDLFDTSLGTLESVSIVARGNIEATGSYDLGILDGENSASVTLSAPVTLTSNSNGDSNTITGSKSFSCAVLLSSSSSTCTAGDRPIESRPAFSVGLSLDTADFLDNGSNGQPSFTLETGAVSVSSLNEILGVNEDGRMRFKLSSVRLTYTYSEAAVDVVPLPAGLPLLLGAFGILGLLRRRATA